MGEIADMMLDGTLCASCGVALGGPEDEPAGYPIFCASCKPHFIDEPDKPASQGKPYMCSECSKLFRLESALDQHVRAKHAVELPF